jgi:hypothetical protein
MIAIAAPKPTPLRNSESRFNKARSANPSDASTNSASGSVPISPYSVQNCR